ncbi:DUF2799 domain-containing protein [Parvularcula flava]|uniref:DUF2799 domain-containing protein n=1 Tax=Aquisalinus luteolus TaxID=1566827 RepID=A0A8J3ERJ0_9PROT|nr:DUF2799 domain-containing protein [Aquisalinus luteolus]NHK28612.1 DUF2799 domain-containing protein [Aquisalinus luteolus]GGH99000.1 hypothetical protein GCM10011355_23920 [Aquisalinus luteolus]
MFKKLTGLFIACVALGGCVSMSEDDCLTANWAAIGANDGVNGAAYSTLETRVNQCREYGVEADLTAYNRGYEDGLRTYCTPRNGFEVGSRGSSYSNVCPVELEPEFLAAYNEGRELYRLESNLRSAENALNSLYAQIDDKEDDIEDLRKRQRKDGTKLPENEYRSRLDDLSGDIRRLRRYIDERQFDVRLARDALNAFAYRRW